MNHKEIKFDYSKAILLFHLEENNTPIEKANKENFYTFILKWRQTLEEKFSPKDIMIYTYLFHKFKNEEIPFLFSKEITGFEYMFPSSLCLYYNTHSNENISSCKREVVLYKGKIYIVYFNLPQSFNLSNHFNFDETNQIYWTPLYLVIKFKKWNGRDQIIMHIPENIKEGVFVHEN